MEEDWYPGQQRGNVLLFLKGFIFKHVSAFCGTRPAKPIYDYGWFFGEIQIGQENAWLDETTMWSSAGENAVNDFTRCAGYAKAMACFYDLPLGKKREVCEKMLAELERMTFPTKYDALYRLLMEFGFYVDREPVDIPCPLAAKIRKMGPDLSGSPNIIRMLVWTLAAENKLYLDTYFKMYDQSLALWTARGKTKGSFPGYKVLAYYVQHKTNLAEKKALGERISHGLEFLHSHYVAHGISPKSAEICSEYRFNKTVGGMVMRSTFPQLTRSVGLHFLKNIYIMIEYRGPAVPDELIDFVEPRFLKGLRKRSAGKNVKGEQP